MSSQQQENEDCVKLILVDFQTTQANLNFLYHQLKTKFINQSKGFHLYRRNKEVQVKHFLPIEFSKDKDYVMKYIKSYQYYYDHNGSRFVNSNLSSIIHPDLLYNNADLVQEMKKRNQIENLSKFVDYHREQHEKSSSTTGLSREYVLAAVKKNGNDLMKFHKFTSDKEIVIEAIKQNGNALYYAEASLRKDRQFIREAIKYNGQTFYYMSEELKKDRELAIEAVKFIPSSFRYASDIFKNDRSFVCEAVSNDGDVLNYVSNDFKKDREIVCRAIVNRGYAIRYASEEFTTDDQLIEEAIKKALQMDENIEIDREIALKYANDHCAYLVLQLSKFRNEKDIVLKALDNNGKRMNSSNRRDRVFLEDMLEQNFKIFSMADEMNVKTQKEVFMKAFDVNCCVFEDSYMSELFFNVYQYRNAIYKTNETIEMDKDIALKVIQQNVSVKRFLDLADLNEQIQMYLRMERFNNDKEFMLSVGKIKDEYLNHVSEGLRDDENFILRAAQISSSITTNLASNRLMNDRNFLLKLLEITESFKAVPFELRSDRNFMMEACRKGSFLYYASDDLKYDRELVLNAVQSRHSNFSYCSEKLKQDREIISHVLKKSGDSIYQLPEELQKDRELVLLALQSEIPLSTNEELFTTFALDRQVMLECSKLDGRAMIEDNFLREEFRNDREFIIEVAGSNSELSTFAFDSFECDLELVEELAVRYGLVKEFDEKLYQKRLESEYFGAKLPIKM